MFSLGLRRSRFVSAAEVSRKFKVVYHKYGLKHVLLLVILLLYSILGAAIFYQIEAPNDKIQRDDFQQHRTSGRRRLIAEKIFPKIFNNTDQFLIFLDQQSSDEIYQIVETEIILYEETLGLRYSHQAIQWDFWNAMLYAGTIYTTIGDIFYLKKKKYSKNYFRLRTLTVKFRNFWKINQNFYLSDK